jgi:hypothetical protein
MTMNVVTGRRFVLCLIQRLTRQRLISREQAMLLAEWLWVGKYTTLIGGSFAFGYWIAIHLYACQ